MICRQIQIITVYLFIIFLVIRLRSSCEPGFQNPPKCEGKLENLM